MLVNVLWLKDTVKRILCDQYLQQWNSEKCNRMFKHDFNLENYSLKLSTKNARILCKFRTGNVKLPIETGRCLILRETIEYVTYAIVILVMSSITFSIFIC